MNPKPIFSILILFALALLMFSCNRQSKRALRKGKVLLKTEKTVTIGKGGGFTGSTVAYVIHPDARVVQKRTTPDEEMDLKTLEKADFNQIHARLDSLDFGQINHKYPGNIYHFITVAGGGTENTVTWGDGEHAVPDGVQAFYDYTIELIRGDDKQ